MTENSLPIKTLRKIPLFACLDDAERKQVGAAAVIEQFKPGEEIVEQGGTSQNLWVVLEGECEVVKRVGEDSKAEEVTLATLGAHETFGEMSFYQSAPHSAAVRAKSKMKLLRLTREAYDKLIDGQCAAAYKLAYHSVESLAERLRRMDEWVAQLIGEGTKPQKVAEWRGFREKLFKEWNL